MRTMERKFFGTGTPWTNIHLGSEGFGKQKYQIVYKKGGIKKKKIPTLNSLTGRKSQSDLKITSHKFIKKHFRFVYR